MPENLAIESNVMRGMATGGTQMVRLPDTFKSFSGLAIAAEATLWTPAAGKKFRIMGYVISSGVASGDIIVKDGTGGATILVIPNNGFIAVISPPMGNGILSATANNLLRVIGVATQTISGYVYGTEE